MGGIYYEKNIVILGALSLISSAAYAKEVLPAVEEQPIVVEEVVKAQPMLRVTDVGQYLEIDNTSGGEDIGQEVHFANYVGLAYGDDWTFGFMARKAWSMDTDDGIHSGDHRLDLDVWKHFNDNFSLGFRFRNQDDFDRYYLRTKYSYGMLSGWIDVAYQSNNGNDEVDHEDAWYGEAIPLQINYGPAYLGYYIEADTWGVDTVKNLNVEKAGFEHWYRQQLRLGTNLYNGEKLTVGVEYRWQFDTDVEYDTKYMAQGKTYAKDDERHIVVLSADYNVTENFSVGGYYQYEWRSYDRSGDHVEDKVDNYYGEFQIGWNYKF